MITKTRGDYLTNWAWFNDIIGGKDMVLCHSSALECLQLFTGYVNEKIIDVYAKKRGEYENINYRILDDFNNIDIVPVDNLLCTSVNQTINDMLSDFDNTDEQALLEALCKYYYKHNNSFDGLAISPENIKHFNAIKEWAIDYYNEGDEHDRAGKVHVPNIR